MLLGVVFLYIGLWKLSSSYTHVRPLAGGTLTEGLIGSPRFINPLLAASPTDEALVQLIYSGLVRRTSDGNFTGDLADYTVSNDGTTYTFTLKPAARFSDGTLVTSDDVLYTFSAIKNGLGPTAVQRAFQSITATKVDNQTISITTTTPAMNNGELLSALTIGIVPAHIWSSIAITNLADSPYELHPVGSGPFTLASHTLHKNVSTELILTRNRFALEKAEFRRYKLLVFANQDALADAVEQHDVELTSALTTIPFAISDPGSGIRITAISTATTVSIVSRSDSPLANAHIRSAVVRSIDNAALIATIENGYGTAASAADSSSSSDPSWTFDDLIHSKEISRGSDGTLKRDGVPITIVIGVESESPQVPLATALKTQLATVGVGVDIRAYDQGTFRTLLAHGQLPNALIDDASAPRSLYPTTVNLYTRTHPIITTNPRMLIPEPIAPLEFFYSTAATWGARSERVWNLFN